MITLEKINGDLKITLTEEGREFLKENRNEDNSDWNKGTDFIYFDLTEGILCEEWEHIRPEECGAMTDGIIISDEAERDDQGNLTKLGRVYWYPNYQIRAEIDDLWEDGECILEGVED